MYLIIIINKQGNYYYLDSVLEINLNIESIKSRNL